MSLPVLSIVAFAVAIVISCVSQINVGFLGIAFAFIIGVVFGGMRAADVAAGFPTSLFLILVGVTLFFSQANVTLKHDCYRGIFRSAAIAIVAAQRTMTNNVGRQNNPSSQALQRARRQPKMRKQKAGEVRTSTRCAIQSFARST